MQRPQKTAEVGCPCEGMLETKSNRSDMKYGIVPAIIVDSKNEMKKGTICVAYENGVLYRTDGLKYKNAK